MDYVTQDIRAARASIEACLAQLPTDSTPKQLLLKRANEILGKLLLDQEQALKTEDSHRLFARMLVGSLFQLPQAPVEPFINLIEVALENGGGLYATANGTGMTAMDFGGIILSLTGACAAKQLNDQFYQDTLELFQKPLGASPAFLN